MNASTKHRTSARAGFTLVELMVVLLIIGILLALIFPGVQSMVENARTAACRTNMQQIVRAMQSFRSNHGHYPASWSSTPAASGSDDVSGWSAQARLLPHLEQSKLFKNIDFTQPYSTSIEIEQADGTVTQLGAMRVPVYLCPSEAKDEARYDGNTPEHYPINYAFNLGTWFVYNPETGEGGNGAFYPDSRLKDSAFTDGRDETLCMAEVKGWTPYFRNKGDATVAPIPDFEETDYLTDPDVVGMGGTLKTNSGHTEWIDGRAHQTGFTTAYPPNAGIIHTESDKEYDVDWTNWQEGKGLAASSPTTTPTFAAVTARSYHPGGVNVVMMGGSVHTVGDDIHPGVWRAYSTRDGEEIIPNEARVNQ